MSANNANRSVVNMGSVIGKESIQLSNMKQTEIDNLMQIDVNNYVDS